MALYIKERTLPRHLDLLIICENTDIIKLYCNQIIDAFRTTSPKPKLQKVIYSSLNEAQTTGLESCEKLLFMTDEKYRSFSTARIRALMTALLKTEKEANRILVVNTNCSEDLTERIFYASKNENTLDASCIDSRIVYVKDIQKIDCWWPRVVKFVFKALSGSEKISFSLTYDKTDFNDYGDLSGMLERCLLQFQTMKKDQICQIIVGDITKENQSITDKESITYALSKTRNKSINDMQIDYGTEETLKLILHILIDFDSVLARRTSIYRRGIASICSGFLAFLIMLVNSPLILLLFAISFIPMSCAFIAAILSISEFASFLIFGFTSFTISGISIGFGAKIYAESTISSTERYVLLIFLCVVTPLYLILWTTVLSGFLLFKRNTRFGVLALPYKICNDMPFVFFKEFCFSDSIHNNKGKVFVLVSILSFPFVLAVMIFLVFHFLFTCSFLVLFEETVTATIVESGFSKRRFRQVFYVATQLQIQLALVVFTVMIGILVQQYVICFLVIPLYLLFIITPGDYLLRRSCSPKYGIFFFLVPLFKFVCDSCQ